MHSFSERYMCLGKRSAEDFKVLPAVPKRAVKEKFQ
jgi:hypothetical protein